MSEKPLPRFQLFLLLALFPCLGVHIAFNLKPGMEPVLWWGIAIIIGLYALAFLLGRPLDKLSARLAPAKLTRGWKLWLVYFPAVICLTGAFPIFLNFSDSLWEKFVRGVFWENRDPANFGSGVLTVEAQKVIKPEVGKAAIGVGLGILLTYFSLYIRFLSLLSDSQTTKEPKEPEEPAEANAAPRLGGKHPDQVPWWEKNH